MLTLYEIWICVGKQNTSILYFKNLFYYALRLFMFEFDRRLLLNYIIIYEVKKWIEKYNTITLKTIIFPT